VPCLAIRTRVCITSVVGWGAAVLAVWLYGYGAGRRPSPRGAVSILVILSVAIVASLVAAFVFDAARDYIDEPSASMLAIGTAFAGPDFVQWLVGVYAARGDIWAPWLLDLGIALLLSLLGVAPTLTRTFRGETAGRRVSVFLVPLAVVLGVFGLWSFFVLSPDETRTPATASPYAVGDCIPTSRDFVDTGETRESLRDRPVPCEEAHAAEIVWTGMASFYP